jgi:hypothetical protein
MQTSQKAEEFIEAPPVSVAITAWIYRFFQRSSIILAYRFSKKILRPLLRRKANFSLEVKGFTTAAEGFSEPSEPLTKQSLPPRVWGGSADRWLIYPESSEQIPMPKTIESGDPAGFSLCLNMTHPPAYVYRFESAVYLGKKAAILNSKRKIYSDIMDAGVDAFPKSTLWELPSLCDGDAYVLSATKNHYHWLIKMLPRMHLLEKVEKSLLDFDTLLINSPILPHNECYNFLGLSEDHLRVVSGNSFVLCQNLYSATIPHSIPSWAPEFLSNKFSSLIEPSVNAPKAVYFSRGAEANIKRRVLNHQEVAEYLTSIGVYCTDLSKASFSEQVNLAAHADLIIAPHGAGLANLVFSKPGTKVLEIFSNQQNQKCYRLIALKKGLTYHYLMADPVPIGDNPNHFDLVISLEKLKKGIDFLLKDSAE